MSQRQGHVLLATLGVIALAGAGVGAFFLGGGQDAALGDAGAFRVGSALGEERAGFSGRPQVQVFASAADPKWPALRDCLGSGDVTLAMAGFVGVLVDVNVEPSVEAIFRQRGLTVIVRGLNGALLGALNAEFTCDELASFLFRTRAELQAEPLKSPVYAALLDSADAVDRLIQSEGPSSAARAVELLKEFEGASSPAVTAAESRLKN